MIVERIYEHARTHPKNSAIIINGQSVNYLDFANYIAFFRKLWAKHELPPGSVAVVISHNRMLGWSAMLALQSLGLVTVSADKISVLKGLDLHRVSCTLMVKISQEDKDAALSYWPEALALELPPTIEEGIVLPKWFETTPGGGHIFYTSGTTGTYKKIFHDAALDQIRTEVRQAGIDTGASAINITFYGPWTAAGYRAPFFMWACGLTVVFDRREDWPLHLGDHGVTQVFLTPGALKNATDALIPYVSHSGPRWAFELIVGGGVTSASLIRLTHELITPNLNLSFGCTEMFLPVMRSTAQANGDDFWLKPMGVRDIDIVDDEGSSCREQVEGTLRIRLQPTDYCSYMNDPETTSRVFRDGWFYPGDMAVRRSDGRIRVLGRTADVIIVRGNKKSSAALEEGLRETLGASAVCAFSGLMADNEDRIVLVVESSTPIAPKIYQQLATQLRRVLGEVHFVELNTFPRTQTGTLKINRMKLRQQIMNGFPLSLGNDC
jgi:acyl-coenzyme A synthetase/AMP-(fatty) acid ligase